MSEAAPTTTGPGLRDAILSVPSFLMREFADFLRDEFHVDSRRGDRYVVEEFLKEFFGAESPSHEFAVYGARFRYWGFLFDKEKVDYLNQNFVEFFNEGSVEIHCV